MFDIFIIALALWTYDHASIIQKLRMNFEWRVTHMTKAKYSIYSTRKVRVLSLLHLIGKAKLVFPSFQLKYITVY